MIRVSIDGTVFSLPSSLPELEFANTSDVLAILFSEASDLEKRVRLVMTLTPKKLRRKLRKLSDTQLYLLAERMDWLTKPLGTAPPFGYIETKAGRYAPPAPRLDSTVLAEYIYADLLFRHVQKSEEAARKLAACLWRPEDPGKQFGDRRIKFDTDRIEHDAAILGAELSPYHLVAIVAYFTACKRAIVKHYTDVFPAQPKENDEESFTLEPESNPAESYIDLMMMLADVGAFGTLEEVKFANVHEVFMYLSRLIRLNEEKKAAYANPH